jgi:hypothetical protein
LTTKGGWSGDIIISSSVEAMPYEIWDASDSEPAVPIGGWMLDSPLKTLNSSISLFSLAASVSIC